MKRGRCEIDAREREGDWMDVRVGVCRVGVWVWGNVGIEEGLV